MADQKTPTRDRPTMQNYGISAEDEGMLSWNWVAGQMEKSRNYWICTTRPDGRPHVAPVWGLWLDGTLYFDTGRGSRKARNLAASPEAIVHLESGDDTVIIEGMLEDMGSGDSAWAARYVEAYEAKYGWRPDAEITPDNVRYRLKPRVVFAWLESDFPNTATRWLFDELDFHQSS